MLAATTPVRLPEQSDVPTISETVPASLTSSGWQWLLTAYTCRNRFQALGGHRETEEADVARRLADLPSCRWGPHPMKLQPQSGWKARVGASLST